jgi:hypothetical protein
MVGLEHYLIVAAALFIYGIQRIDTVGQYELPTDDFGGQWRGVDSRGVFAEVNWRVEIHPATDQSKVVAREINQVITETMAEKRCGSTDDEEHEEEYEGLAARVIQHEYDHIEGVLFTDRLSSLKKRLLKGKLNAIAKGDCDNNYRMKFAFKEGR